MSIILNALKKADASQNQEASQVADLTEVGSGIFNPDKKNSKPTPKKSNVRLLILTACCLTSIAVFNIAKTYFHKAPVVVSAAIPKTNFTPPPATQNTLAGAVGAQAQSFVDAAAGAMNLNGPSAEEKKIEDLKLSAEKNYQLGKYADSSSDYEKLSLLLPTNAEVYNNYGLSLKRNDKLKEAKEVYNKALALNPDYPEALNNIAVTYMASNDYNEAIKYLKKAIELDSDYIDPYLHMALCLEKSGETKASIAYYQSFLKMSDGKVERKIRLQVESRVARLNEEVSTVE